MNTPNTTQPEPQTLQEQEAQALRDRIKELIESGLYDI